MAEMETNTTTTTTTLPPTTNALLTTYNEMNTNGNLRYEAECHNHNTLNVNNVSTPQSLIPVGGSSWSNSPSSFNSQLTTVQGNKNTTFVSDSSSLSPFNSSTTDIHTKPQQDFIVHNPLLFQRPTPLLPTIMNDQNNTFVNFTWSSTNAASNANNHQQQIQQQQQQPITNANNNNNNAQSLDSARRRQRHRIGNYELTPRRSDTLNNNHNVLTATSLNVSSCSSPNRTNTATTLCGGGNKIILAETKQQEPQCDLSSSVTTGDIQSKQQYQNNHHCRNENHLKDHNYPLNQIKTFSAYKNQFTIMAPNVTPLLDPVSDVFENNKNTSNNFFDQNENNNFMLDKNNNSSTFLGKIRNNNNNNNYYYNQPTPLLRTESGDGLIHGDSLGDLPPAKPRSTNNVNTASSAGIVPPLRLQNAVNIPSLRMGTPRTPHTPHHLGNCLPKTPHILLHMGHTPNATTITSDLGTTSGNTPLQAFNFHKLTDRTSHDTTALLSTLPGGTALHLVHPDRTTNVATAVQIQQSPRFHQFSTAAPSSNNFPSIPTSSGSTTLPTTTAATHLSRNSPSSNTVSQNPYAVSSPETTPPLQAERFLNLDSHIWGTRNTAPINLQIESPRRKFNSTSITGDCCHPIQDAYNHTTSVPPVSFYIPTREVSKEQQSLPNNSLTACENQCMQYNSGVLNCVSSDQTTQSNCFPHLSNPSCTDPMLSVAQSSYGSTQQQQTTQQRTDVRLFVGRIPKWYTNRDLKEVFDAFGHVLECNIIRDRRAAQSQGCGFVRLANIQIARNAIEILNQTVVLDPDLGPVQVKFASGELERLGLPLSLQPGGECVKLFFGNLAQNTTEAELNQLFGSFGKYEELCVLRDRNKRSKCSGFITFYSTESAQAAISALNGHHYVAGATRPLEVRFAVSRTQRSVKIGTSTSSPKPQTPSTGFGSNRSSDDTILFSSAGFRQPNPTVISSSNNLPSKKSEYNETTNGASTLSAASTFPSSESNTTSIQQQTVTMHHNQHLSQDDSKLGNNNNNSSTKKSKNNINNNNNGINNAATIRRNRRRGVRPVVQECAS